MIHLATLFLPAMLGTASELAGADSSSYVLPVVAAPQGASRDAPYGNGIGNGPGGSGNPHMPSGGTPEPSLLLLFAGGALAYGGYRFRKSRVTGAETR